MCSVKGIYDGEKVQLLENVADLKPGKIIITFIDDENEVEALREYAADEDAFGFGKRKMIYTKTI